MVDYRRITPRQQECLEALRVRWKANHYGPSLSELGSDLGGIRPGNVHRLLVALELVGAVRVLGGDQSSRKWVPVDEAESKPARGAG